MEFVLSEGRLDSLKGEIARLTKRATKLGVDAPTLTVVEVDPRPYPVSGCNTCYSQGRMHCTEHRDKLYAAFSVTIDSPIVQVADYSVSARIDHVEGIVTSLREGYAHRYKDAEPVCEHCRENRRRNVTYVLTDSHGSDIQVGSTCLKDFTGAHDAEQIAHLLSLYYLLAEYGDGDGWEMGGGGGTRRINTRDYLACANMAIGLDGWVPKSAVPFGGQSTASFAFLILNPPKESKLSPPGADDYKRADSAIAWAKGEAESTNDYLLTISNLAQKEYFDPRYAGYVASIISAYDRAEGRRVEMELRKKAQSEIVAEIFAEVGTRIKDISVTITNVRHFDSDYGTTTLVNMRTADNHALSWFASRDPKFAIGESATLTGTIKGYDEKYSATKLTRCKLV